MLLFQLESWDSCLPEILELFKEHEIELSSALPVKVNLNMGHYEQLYNGGRLLLLTARDKGVMVGYCIMQLAPHHRAKDVLVAKEEAMWLRRDHRKGYNGVRLVKKALLMAKFFGAELAYFGSSEAHPIGTLLKYCGFKKASEIFTINLLEKENG